MLCVADAPASTTSYAEEAATRLASETDYAEQGV